MENLENNPLFVKVRVTKRLYKMWDRYERYQRWLGKQLLEGYMTQKYKACCGRRCLVLGCKINENGGCFCACRSNDSIQTLKRAIDGSMIYRGSIYYADPNERQKHLDRMTPEQRAREDHFRLIEAPELLKKYEEKFKEFIDDQI